MNLSQLYYFKKLAEVQHYTKAAKALYITQPSLSEALCKKGTQYYAYPVWERILSVCFRVAQ